MRDGEPETTADQDAWIALWEQIRLRLGELVPLIPAMKPDEAKQVVDTVLAAQWGHFQALTLDKRVELELARATAD
ncbi:MAG: hypothetical protein JWO38_4890 [Gemmataceae bacterium]|nr:hypothetical protein [Gemmataceae bacterium]